METLILGWYVLVETGSVLMLTVFGALQYLGTLIAPMFGVVGDRIGHRNLLAGMRSVYTALASTLMAFAFARLLEPFLVLVIAGLSGLVRPSDMGMRAALVAETMPVEHLASAASISRTTSDSARVAGALAGAGLFAALGMGPAYLVVSGFYAAGLVLTLCVPRRCFAPPAPGSAAGAVRRPSAWRELGEGIAYIWRTPHLLAAMWLAFLVNLTAFPFSGGLLPYVARELYGSDQTGLGYLAASFAGGAFAGSVVLSFVSSRIRPARMMILFGAAWYAMLLVFAQVQNLAGGMLALFVTGFVQSFSMVPLTVLLLRTADEKFRGRVMGVRMMAIYSLPLGLLGAGALIDRIGFAATATAYAAVGLACVAAIGLRWRAQLWSAEAPGNAR